MHSLCCDPDCIENKVCGFYLFIMLSHVILVYLVLSTLPHPEIDILILSTYAFFGFTIITQSGPNS